MRTGRAWRRPLLHGCLRLLTAGLLLPPATVAAQEAASPDVPEGAADIPPGQELVNIDFPEPTEIKDIIKAVALWTGKNVILDRNVSGKVQIISPKKVTKEEAYQAFLSALNILGLTTVETGKIIKIMPVRTAVKGNLKTFLGSSWTPMTDEIITQIVPLKYIDAKSIRSTLSRIVSSNAMIAYEPTNTLIISDSGYKVRRVLDILELLDVQGQQPQVAIVPIRYADAKSIADKVSEIFKTSSKGSKGASFNKYKIMTDERTNSVVIFGPPRTIADVKALVRKFDVQLDDPSRQATIHVRPLDYADAKKLAATLSALAGGAKRNTRTTRRPPISRSPNKTPKTPAATNAQPSVAQLGDDLKITADEASNSLIITGSRAAYDALNTIIRKLDIRRSQVFVEADILDLNMDAGFSFRTSVFAGFEDKDATKSTVATTWQAGPLGPLITSQASGDANQSQQQLEQVAGVFAEDLTIGILSGEDVEIAGLGKFRPGGLIKLIKSDESTRILSTPSILTSNNEEASISVGETLYFRSSETSPTSGVIANKAQKEKVDLTLSIKPNISHSAYVTLTLDLQANSLAGIDPGSGFPRISTRKSKQIVTVRSGQTVVISGLVRSEELEAYEKIPVLGDIPILGWLFRNSSLKSRKSNLLIFLTPNIIHGADDLAAVYKQKMAEKDRFLALMQGEDYSETEFYADLPSDEDGQYRPDPADEEEKRRREAMLRELYDASESGDEASQ